MLTKGVIPNLIGGVSQQPMSSRHVSQVDEMLNMHPSPVYGLRRRNGTRFIAKMAPADYSKAWTHAIDFAINSEAGRYFAIIYFDPEANQGNLKVLNYLGEEQVVNFPDGKDYLNVPNPMNDFAACTVGDYTFITNKNVTVGMEPAGAYSFGNAVFVWVKVAVPNGSYTVTLNGTPYTHTAGATVTTDGVATALNTLIAGAGFTVTQLGSVLKIDSGSAFSWASTDSYGNQAMNIFHDTVSRYEELPRQFFTGYKIKVLGDPDGSNNPWYVEWNGEWSETVKGGIPTIISPATMPHRLYRDPSSGEWTFEELSWDPRQVGDEDSNPLPSFVGQGEIKDIFFFRNRLGFLCLENVIMSKAGDYYDFFAPSARTVTDADPIDIAAPGTNVRYLFHAITFDKAILLFSDKAQYQLVSGDVLSPRTVKIEPTTQYDCLPFCKPVSIGKNVFFASQGTAQSTGYPSVRVREYWYDGLTITNDATDVTSHCPGKIDFVPTRMVASSQEGMLLAFQHRDQTGRVRVYNELWNGDEKVQSAWHDWSFWPMVFIWGMHVFGSELYIFGTLNSEDDLFLKMSLLPDPAQYGFDYQLCLDNQIVLYGADAVYDAASDTTLYELPYSINFNSYYVDPAEAGISAGAYQPRFYGQQTNFEVYRVAGPVDQVGTHHIRLDGDQTFWNITVGSNYLSLVGLNEVFVRDQQNNALPSDRLMVRDYTFHFEDTTYFRVDVLPLYTPYQNGIYGEVNTYVEYSGNVLDSTTDELSEESTNKGNLKVPILHQSDQYRVRVSSYRGGPFDIQSWEWAGAVHKMR